MWGDNMRMDRRAGLLAKEGAYLIIYQIYDSWIDWYDKSWTGGPYASGTEITVPAEQMAQHPDYGYSTFHFEKVCNLNTDEVYSTSTTFVMPNFPLIVYYNYS